LEIHFYNYYLFAVYVTKLAHGDTIEYHSSSLKLSRPRSFAFTFVANKVNPNAVSYKLEIDGFSRQENVSHSVIKEGFGTHFYILLNETPMKQVKIALTTREIVRLVSLGLSSAGIYLF
jgi:hypothetical protein